MKTPSWFALVGLLPVAIGLWAFWMLLQGRSPGFRWGESGRGPRAGPVGRWFGAVLFVGGGVVFILAGTGVIKTTDSGTAGPGTTGPSTSSTPQILCQSGGRGNAGGCTWVAPSAKVGTPARHPSGYDNALDCTWRVDFRDAGMSHYMCT